ncbi:MAG: DUF2284 domain-containing protein [Candidatus Lokiarchaeota archaeon]|nr:DUF2284 domain-containing protein [Candidatus Lokiarchaeota archaeon]
MQNPTKSSKPVPIPDVDREDSKMAYKWRRVLPKKYGREPSPMQLEPKQEIFDELLKRANKYIKDAIEKYKVECVGHAKFIDPRNVIIDPRVRMKCRVPICFGYGSNLNCPPHSPTAEEMREIVDCYNYAIMVSIYPPVENNIFPSILTGVHGDVNLLNEIVSWVEAEATYLGYYLAMGFKGGPCVGCGMWTAEFFKDLMQQKKLPKCPSLEGELCRQYLRARPALEACGVDVFATAVKCGEKPLYVINPEHDKTGVPYVAWHGIVFIM